MSGERRAWLDVGPGERRGVITLDGRPEHLFIERSGGAPSPRLGERWRVRLGTRSPDRREAFVDLGGGLRGVLRLTPDARCSEGALLEAEVSAEPHAGKTARLGLIGPAEDGTAPGLALAAPPLEVRLARLAPGGPVTVGDEAREAADLAEESTLATSHTLSGGVTLSVETTRAMTVIDVDLRTAGERGPRAMDANLRAIRHAARLLRLKALGGTCAIDLIGFPNAIQPIMAEAKRAFAPDGEVALLPPNRFGVLMLARPRGRRPIHELLLGPDGRPTPRTLAQRLVRTLDREGRADPGALLTAVCAPTVAVELAPLAAELGPRFMVEAAPGVELEDAHIRRR